MNTELLIAKIESKNVSKSEIAEKLGISRQSLYNKLSGDKEFKASEIRILSSVLYLSDNERDSIFFADFVDKNANNLQDDEQKGA